MTSHPKGLAPLLSPRPVHRERARVRVRRNNSSMYKSITPAALLTLFALFISLSTTHAAPSTTTTTTSTTGDSATTKTAAAPKASAATLIVTPAEAQKLELAKNQGKISLTLEPADS